MIMGPMKTAKARQPRVKEFMMRNFTRVAPRMVVCIIPYVIYILLYGIIKNINIKLYQINII